MGLASKVATKVRTAAKTEVVPLPRPYEDAGAVVAAAVIRAAASVIGQLRLTSSTARGTDILGIREAGSAHVSTVSVTQTGQETWLVMLGVPTVSGWSADWQVKIVLSQAPAGVTATLTTPATLTRDGTLVNKSAHGELRDLVLSGLRAGVLPGGSAETAVSAAALASAQLQPVRVAVTPLAFRTGLSPGEVMTALARVPFPLAERQPDALCWRLGTAGALSESTAWASIADDGMARTVKLHCQPQPAGSAVTDALIARRAAALLAAAERALRGADSGIERSAGLADTQRQGEPE
jgi:hypothetical protein